MLIKWIIHEQFPSSVLSAMQKAADLSLSIEHVDLACSISVCLCDDSTIASVNRQYRKIERSTDVLSFPTVSYPYGKTAGQCPALLRKEYDDESSTCFLGDLMISVPHTIVQAREYGHSVLREAVYLLVHGICHLMGYDHIETDDKEKMRKMEEKILNACSVTRDSVDISNIQELLSIAKKAMEYSYSPYSHFPVGAALHCTDGRIFTGCNIENASFGLTNCAERTALFKAVSEGAMAFDVLVIAAHKKAWPCGACRQVLNEFAPDLRIVITWENQVAEKTLPELLPESFGPGSM